MATIKIFFERDDIKFIQALRSNFGSDLQFNEEEGFDGGQFISIIISLVALSFQIADFLKTNMGDERNNVEQKKRFIRTAQGDIYLEGYTTDEIRILLGGMGIE